jgi:hypothetical protein
MSDETPRLHFTMRDISAQTYGKYQFCTLHKDGLWYADIDFDRGKPKRGALPCPDQDTPALTERARAMHAQAAAKMIAEVLSPPRASPPRPSLLARLYRWLCR